tara:strand:- start:4179 stop:4490 length:312 start_codon:yes stop_codon:yes gene_type:complete
MSQTTQAQLLELAKKHAENPVVTALRTSLLESKNIAAAAHQGLEGHLEAQRHAIAGVPGFSVTIDNSDFVATAAKASAALSRMAGDYLTLACVLQALGEDISY